MNWNNLDTLEVVFPINYGSLIEKGKKLWILIIIGGLYMNIILKFYNNNNNKLIIAI